MFKLVHKVTEQVMEFETSERVQEFLAAVEDGAHWVEHKAEQAVEVVEETLGLKDPESAPPAPDAAPDAPPAPEAPGT